MSAANFSALKPAFDSKGVTLLGIGVEKLGYQEFVEGGFFNGELLVDEKKESYNALACHNNNTWRNLWGMSLLFSSTVVGLGRVASQKGFSFSNMKGDGNQFGGTFVLSPKDGALMYGHYQTADSFEPSMVGIMEALEIPVPDDYDPHAAADPTAKNKM